MKNNSRQDIQRFFAMQKPLIDAKYHSAAGYDDDYDDDYNDYDNIEGGDGVDANGAFQYADDFNAGGVAQMPARKSQPYIITVQNTTTADILNVVIGQSYIQLYSTDTVGFGNTTGIVITSGIPGTTYRQWLTTLQLNPYTVGLTIVRGLGDSDSEANAQAAEIVTLAENLADGNNAGRPVILELDPYQNQNNIVANHTSYKMDAYLTITIARIIGGASMQFKFYPQSNVSQTRGLAGSAPVRQFLPPNVVNLPRYIQQGQPQRLPVRRAVRRG